MKIRSRSPSVTVTSVRTAELRWACLLVVEVLDRELLSPARSRARRGCRSGSRSACRGRQSGAGSGASRSPTVSMSSAFVSALRRLVADDAGQLGAQVDRGHSLDPDEQRVALLTPVVDDDVDLGTGRRTCASTCSTKVVGGIGPAHQGTISPPPDEQPLEHVDRDWPRSSPTTAKSPSTTPRLSPARHGPAIVIASLTAIVTAPCRVCPAADGHVHHVVVEAARRVVDGERGQPLHLGAGRDHRRADALVAWRPARRPRRRRPCPRRWAAR